MWCAYLQQEENKGRKQAKGMYWRLGRLEGCFSAKEL